MLRNVLLHNPELHDLNPLIAGEEDCEPGHSFGPAVRNYTLIHYILSGRGTFEARGQVWPVQAGQAFLILPGEVTFYRADEQEPWHYQWIGFDGGLAQRFSELPAVFPLNAAVFREAFARFRDSAAAEYEAAAALFRLYSELFCQKQEKNAYVRRVENYVQAAYMEKISVEKLAAQLNLDRHYLTRLFRQSRGVSIQQYILNVRMEAACRYLSAGYGVQTVAHLCGYDDPSDFSRLFKRQNGLSPKLWQEQSRQTK